MANPRKFSEKIALHNQKQAEETAAFEQIMREVSDATAKPDDGVLAQFGLAAINNFEESLKHPPYRESRGRSVGVGPMRSRPIERKIDTSPYSSATYLSPPPDSSWRRTSSDSALHQSVQGQDNMHSHGHGLMSPAAQRRVMDNHSDQMHHQHNHLQDGRPRSSCEVPRVPGINIYPSAHDPGAIQIPIGNNTGSLPDLTSVHFPSPLHTPLDQEPDHSSSPYSSSPVTASPTTLSPTSLPARQQSARFQFSPTHSPQGQVGHSPHSGMHTILQDSGGYSPTHGQSQNHLSVPVNSRYLHHNKGVTLENNLPQGYMSQQSGRQQYNVQSNTGGLVYAPQMSPRSPSIHGSHGNINLSHSPTYSFQQMQPQVSGYRSPGLRPSPGSSPGLGIQTGVADAGHSAPCSPRGATHSAPYDPGSFNTNPNADSYYISPALLQQHFEQFSMMDTPVPTSLDYINAHSPSQSHFTQSAVSAEDVASLVNAELGQDPGYYSTSPSTLHYNQQDNTPRQTTPQTPNTPTSIPNIILTDFSNSAAGAELSKELNSAITGNFDHNDFFPSDESLREGLDPIDFDGLQMLTDPDMNVDPNAEDAFRLDRL